MGSADARSFNLPAPRSKLLRRIANKRHFNLVIPSKAKESRKPYSLIFQNTTRPLV